MTAVLPRYKNIILPSENQTREFDAKLLLAVVLAARGCSVVIGARHAIHNHIADFPRSVYIAKDFRKPSERILSIISGLGHHVVAWDEEGLVQPVPELYYQRRTTPAALSHIKAAFAWGPANERLMRNAPHWPDIPIHRTGNPRLDLLRSELREFHAANVEALRGKLGRFVLFDSNFASFNPAVTSVAPVLGPGGGAPSPFLLARQRLFERWKLLIPKLAMAIAPHGLIVRPHPAEAHGLWLQVCAGFSNIKVIHKGAALPWILAADAMVHSGCTTGLEAYFLGRQAIAFRPEDALPLAQDLPDSLSVIARTEDELIDLVGQRLRQGPEQQHATALEMIADDAAYARNGSLASARIADVICDIVDEKVPRKLSAMVQARLRQFEKLITALNPKHKTSDAINRLRYPGEGLAQVEQKTALLLRLLHLNATLGATELAHDIFRIESR